MDLYDQLDDIVDRKVAANVNALVRNTLHQESFLLRSPLVESLKTLGCSPFVIQIAAFQISRTVLYVHAAVAEGEGWSWHL